ncbi:zincin-like metallopeptidase domain-containing protein, partial [Acinetobacter lwoffii]|uniref:ArdC family protein n=1 Tax=Acinetobacter lwoffii TaxID=28090 RepID=UPI002730B945
MKKEYVQDIADRLIEQIKSNTAPWQKPWEAGKSIDVLPINLNTGNPYRGMNLVNLMSVAEAKGFTDNRWITYKGAEKLGAQVRKGEKSTSVHYWKFSEEVALKDEDGKPVLDKDGKQVTVQMKLDKPRVFFANVFNAEQVEGLPPKEQVIKPLEEWQRHKRAEEILEASGVRIRHKPGDSAYYRPSTDEITLPIKEQFPTADNYYATALHELGHATGHPSRLNRDLSGGFGSVNYAKEELRAEMASLFIGQELQIGHDPGQHIAYLKSWVKVLEDDPKEIFRAARDADLISSYLLDLSQEQKIENTQTSDQDIEEIKQVFLLRQQNTDLDQSVKTLNKMGKKAGFTLALKPSGCQRHFKIDPFYLKNGEVKLTPLISY